MGFSLFSLFFFVFLGILVTGAGARSAASAAALTVGTSNALLSFFLRPNDISKRTADDQHDHTDDNPIRQSHKHSPSDLDRLFFRCLCFAFFLSFTVVMYDQRTEYDHDHTDDRPTENRHPKSLKASSRKERSKEERNEA